MEIRFKSDDPLHPEEFADWIELANAQPWGLLDVESLNNDKCAFLISEFEKYIEPERIREGDEEQIVVPSPFQTSDPIVRFARANLPRFLEDPDILEIAKAEAEAFFGKHFEGYQGAGKTFIFIQSCKPKVSVNHRPMTVQEYVASGGNLFAGHRGDTLYGAYLSGALPVLSKEWHAMRIIHNVARLQSGNVADEIKLAIETGESRQALLMKTVKASDTSRGGKARKLNQETRVAQRNSFLQSEFEKLPARWSVDQKLATIESTLAQHTNCTGKRPVWTAIKKRQIRKILMR